MRSVWDTVSKWLLVLTLIAALALCSFQLLLFQLRPDVVLALQPLSGELWHYLLFDDNPGLPNNVVLSMAERRHMWDVKQLLYRLELTWVAVLVASLFLALMLKRQSLWRAGMMLWGSAIIIIVLLLPFLIVDFRGFFAWAHSWFFAANSYMFLSDSPLIRVFPLQYFQHFALGWLGLFILLLLVMGYVLRIVSQNRADSVKVT